MMTKLDAIAGDTHKLAGETHKVAWTNRLLSVALLVLALTGAAGMFWVDGRLGHLSEKVKPSAAEEQRRLRDKLAADEKVEALLERAATDLDADRTLVFLAHNGTTDLTGIVPFVWISNTHVHLRAGLTWDERWSRPRSLSSFVPLMRKMFRDGMDKAHCVKRDRGDADISAVARAGMIDRGVEVSLLCPLVTAKGEFIGWAAAEYLRRETAPRDAVSGLRRVERAALEVRIALTEKP